MLTISRINELRDIVKWTRVFRAAGLNENTMRSAMMNRRELRPHEIAALSRVLKERGIVVTPVQQRIEFPESPAKAT